MGNLIKMDQGKIKIILNNYKNVSNKDLLDGLKFLESDFNKTKDLILKLTHHLDSTEISYNKILAEFNKRTNT